MNTILDWMTYKPKFEKKFRCRSCGKWFIAHINHKNECDECIEEWENREDN